jgi:hypothetical protein
MLFNPQNINLPTKDVDGRFGLRTSKRIIRSEADIRKNLDACIGLLGREHDIHFYSFGHFNLVRLVIHILEQTGNAHLFMSSYSFNKRSIEQLSSKLTNGEILSFRLLIDHRVKVMSPKPFDMIMRCFNYRCSSIHSKIALIWNDDWHISVVTSQNATDNPKMERGTIFTGKEVFDFDLKVMENEFYKGTD